MSGRQNFVDQDMLSLTYATGADDTSLASAQTPVAFARIAHQSLTLDDSAQLIS